MKNRKFLTFILVVLSLVAVAAFSVSCGNKNQQSSEPTTPSNEAVVVFNTNTTLETNAVNKRYIVLGRRISEPKVFITGENPDNLNVYGWYTSKNCTEDTRWDFKKDKVSGNVTLYAKWVPLREVNYVVNGELHSSINVFEGDYVEETAEMVMGYKYLGSYADEDHSELFDFSAPIAGDTNIYVGRSAGLYLSDYEEEGLLSAGNLTDYLTAGCGSFNAADGTEEGWVESYTIEETGEKCTYVNFGLNPKWGDGYVELSLMLDISQSQVLRLTFKNLGNASKINCYFTAMIDEDTYSETGTFYTSNFNWPNYIGGPVGDALEIPTNMSETGEWITVDFNLYEVYKNGYSIWGTSQFLGAIRIDANYKNKNSDDWTNEMLIKSIEGIPVDILVEDSAEAQEVLGEAMSTWEEDVIEAGASREELANGIDFVKDYASVSSIKNDAEVYPTTSGILMYAQNEILARESGITSQGFVIKLPEGREVSFETLTTLNITLQNYGYQDELSIYVYNDQGTPIRLKLEMNTRMFEPKTFSVNLYGLFGVEEDRTFKRIEFIYTPKGVDNMILFQEVSFSEFRPFDTVGLNFNDKFTYGFQSNDDVEIKYNSKDKGTTFNVKTNGVVITSPEKTYDATNEGYGYMSLLGKIEDSSNITAVTAELKVNGEWGSPYVYEITESGNLNIKLPLVRAEAGYVKAVRLTFTGTGSITIKELAYSVDENSLPFYGSYDTVYNSGHTDWKGAGDFYEYDAKNQASLFIKGPLNSHVGASIYIGYSANEPYLSTPHTTKNVYVPRDATKVVVTLVYQNRTSVNDMGIHVSFDNTDVRPGDGSSYAIWTNHGVLIDCDMGDYEWSAVSITLEGDALRQYLGSYLAKVNFAFHSEQIAIRAISISVE